MTAFTVIHRSGRALFYSDKDYWTILREVYQSFQTGGSNHDHANMLLMEGKVVVAEDLSNLAWNFCRDNDVLVETARAKARGLHRPDWLP